MDKNDVIDYVMTTPGNTNRAVLNGMLDNIKGESIDFGTMDFTRAGVRYIILDFHDIKDGSPFYTINVESTPNEIIDYYGYKRLYTVEEVRTAINSIYELNTANEYVEKPEIESHSVIGPRSVRVVPSSGPSLPVYNNEDGNIEFYDPELNDGIILTTNDTWIYQYEG